MKEWLLMGASAHEKIVNAKFLRLRHSPRRNPFAANTVLKLAFALDDQDPTAIIGECPRQRRSAEATARDDYIEIMSCHQPPDSEALAIAARRSHIKRYWKN
jgi:hypothetical protein